MLAFLQRLRLGYTVSFANEGYNCMIVVVKRDRDGEERRVALPNDHLDEGGVTHYINRMLAELSD